MVLRKVSSCHFCQLEGSYFDHVAIKIAIEDFPYLIEES